MHWDWLGNLSVQNDFFKIITYISETAEDTSINVGQDEKVSLQRNWGCLRGNVKVPKGRETCWIEKYLLECERFGKEYKWKNNGHCFPPCCHCREKKVGFRMRLLSWKYFGNHLFNKSLQSLLCTKIYTRCQGNKLKQQQKVTAPATMEFTIEQAADIERYSATVGSTWRRPRCYGVSPSFRETFLFWQETFFQGRQD